MWACPLVGMPCPTEGLSALGALPVHLGSCPHLNAQKRNTEAITEGTNKLSLGCRNVYQHAGNVHRKAETAICLEDAGRYQKMRKKKPEKREREQKQNQKQKKETKRKTKTGCGNHVITPEKICAIMP